MREKERQQRQKLNSASIYPVKTSDRVTISTDYHNCALRIKRHIASFAVNAGFT